MRNAILKVVIEYDETQTDAESVATALDTLMTTALSTPGILDEYGHVDVGEFLIAQDDAQTLPI
jgi:hypothetical protein